jgi:O-antigen/teichoic acid export membrane protein
VVPLSLFIFIFPKFIIYVLAGPKYYDAIPILQLTILFSLVRPLSYQFGSTLDAIGKPQANFYVNLCLMIFNLGATYLGLRYFDGMGAAYATVAFCIVSYIVMVAMLKKHIHLEVKNMFRYMIQFYKDMLGFARKKLAKTSGS